MQPPQPGHAARGLAYAVAGSVLVSTNFITVKYSLADGRGFNVPTLVLAWTAGAAFWALLILAVRGRLRELAVPRGDRLGVLALGVCGGIGIGLAWWGLSSIDPSFAAFLWRFLPVMAIVCGAAVLHERLSFWEWAAIAVMFAGSCLGVVGRWREVGPGALLTLGSCVLGGVAMLAAKMKSARLSAGALAFYRVGIGAALMTAALLLAVPERIELRVEAKYWIVLLLGALLGPCVAHVFTFKAYQYWDLSRASIVKIAEPLIVLPLAWLFLDKLPSGREAVGGLIILAGAFWLTWLHVVRARG